MSAALTVLTGPMFSGKTRELAQVIQTRQIAGLRTLVLKPVRDNRTIGTIKSRAGVSLEFQAFEVSTAEQMRSYIDESEHNVLIIDEAQFFDGWLPGVVQDLLAARSTQKYEIVVAGLDMDFMKQPFGSMPQLMAMADRVVKLKAVCGTCKTVPPNAIFSKKIAGDMNVQSEVGDSDKYTAVCRSCY
jgi:thymidine kinase